MKRIMIFLSKHMMSCDEASFMVSRKIDGKITLSKRVSLKFHLLTCKVCQHYARQIEQLNRLVGNYSEACTHTECVHQLPDEKKEHIHLMVDKELNLN